MTSRQTFDKYFSVMQHNYVDNIKKNSIPHIAASIQSTVRASIQYLIIKGLSANPNK